LTVRDVTDEKTAAERVRWRASHDPLTRLANRELFQEKLEQAIAAAKQRGEALGVLMLDLDSCASLSSRSSSRSSRVPGGRISGSGGLRGAIFSRAP
jgi:predicted signal transduction protein with EAL and GGDEF domain